MTTAVQFQAQVDKAATNMARLDRIVNGGKTELVPTDGGIVPSVANVLANLTSYNPRGNWQAGVAYAVRDTVINGGVVYFAPLAHTSSGNFANDLAAGNWAILQGALTSDVTAAVNTLAQRDVRPDAPLPTRSVEFGADFVGNIPDGVKLAGGATATVVAAAGALKAIGVKGYLEINAPYDSPNQKAWMPAFRFREGRFRALVVRGGNMLRFVDRTFAGRAIWENDGAIFFGHIDGNGSPVEGLGQGAMAGQDGDAVWIELLTGPARVGLTAQIRCWKMGTPYPANATITANYSDTYRFNDGAVMFSSFAGKTAKIVGVQSMDGAVRDLPIYATADTNGRWSSAYRGGNLVANTIRTGSSWASRVTGATGVRTVFVRGVDENQPSVITAIVNGVARPDFVRIDGAAGSTAVIDYPNDLNPLQTYDIEWIVRGIAQGIDKWGKGTGVSIIRSTGIGATSRVMPLPFTARPILFIGDSITEGVRAYGLADSPDTFGGDICYGRQSVKFLPGYRAVISAFGGTGLTVGNLSNQPSAQDGGIEPASSPTPGVTYPFGHAWNYMWDRPIDTVSENFEAAVINLGTNDASRGVAGSVFQTSMTNFLGLSLLRFPRSRKIFVLTPFNGSYRAEILAAAAAVADDRILPIDTSNWAGITYADGLHPDAQGHTTIANYLGPALAANLP